MTLSSEYALGCKCGYEFKADLYNSINVTLDPSLLKKLFTGEINRVEYPKCHTKAHIRKSLLFHDLDNDLMILAENGNLDGLVKDLKSRKIYPEFNDTN